VEYDLLYIENWTFFWDIKIIWRSVFSYKSQQYLQEILNQAAI